MRTLAPEASASAVPPLARVRAPSLPRRPPLGQTRNHRGRPPPHELPQNRRMNLHPVPRSHYQTQVHVPGLAASAAAPRPARPQARPTDPHQHQQPHLSQVSQGPSPSHHGYDERGGSTSVVIRRCLTSTTGTPPRRPLPGTQQRHARPNRARHAPHAHRRVPPAEGGAHGTTRQVRARGREAVSYTHLTLPTNREV